ncbi:hypothetical protein Gotur_029245, partial [Gossypium turneri]
MTRLLFQDFVRWFDARMTGIKMLLIVDNFPAHPKILNYPSENESLMESPTDEEIIQGVMDAPVDDEQDPNDSSVLPDISPKEAFLAVDTFKSYLIQHEKNIPNLVYALLKVK